MHRCLIVLVCLLLPALALSNTFKLPESGDLIGKLQYKKVISGEDFDTISRSFDVGYYELVEANPGVDPDHPKPGTILVIPTRYVLPNAKREGIVINLSELRLYYFHPEQHTVDTYPLGIGRQNWATPTGEFRIIEKTPHPVWRPPESIREEYYQHTGEHLAKKIAPGGDNPLGDYAMRLSNPMYLMHGTNDPKGVGKRASSGCIRMFPEDIEALFHKVPKGTSVVIVNQPYKSGWLNGRLYFEAHMPLQEQQKQFQGSLEPAKNAIRQKTLGGRKGDPVNWEKAMKAAGYEMGVPLIIQNG